MASLDTYTCNECGTAFKSMAGANAAEAGYCSPACETEGKEL